MLNSIAYTFLYIFEKLRKLIIEFIIYININKL